VKRILLIGGSGQLGTAILHRWRDCRVVAPPREELALESEAQLRETIERERPDVVVNAAAFHDVDGCEAERDRAFEVNAFAVGAAAALAAQHDAVFVTLSTDYVFDGKKNAPYTEADAPNPLSCYGASKLEGERLTQAAGGRAFVVRTCGLYGASRSRRRRTPFIERVLSQTAREAPLPVVADVVASPTYAGHLADALRRLLDTDSFGLYHAAGAGAVTWYEFAREAIRQAGVPLDVQPIGAEQWKAAAIRPRYSALDNAKLRAAGIGLPPWRDGIAAYLQHGVG
jgi:dTDP-4-dehydrorhamnose reductase